MSIREQTVNSVSVVVPIQLNRRRPQIDEPVRIENPTLSLSLLSLSFSSLSLSLSHSLSLSLSTPLWLNSLAAPKSVMSNCRTHVLPELKHQRKSIRCSKFYSQSCSLSAHDPTRLDRSDRCVAAHRARLASRTPYRTPRMLSYRILAARLLRVR